MALVSPGVEVTIIDESQYSSAAQNTVPYILLATAQDKLTPSGTAIAPGTLASALGDVYLVTSQRDLVNTFGNPTFYKTSGGDALHGYELNEYGLMAAYSVLGATNRAYVQRVDVDMSQLEASLVRPIGAPDNGAYWFDLAESEMGLFVWDLSTNSFTNVTPLIITELSDLVGGVDTGAPLASIGTIGSYAINTTSPNNPVYWKNNANAWVLVGSDAWKESTATVIGTTTPSAAIAAGDLLINGTTTVTITALGTFALQVVEIDGQMPANTGAALVNGSIEFYSSEATLVIADGTADTVLVDLGVAADTYNTPVLTHDTHIAIPRWRATDTTYRPTGSIWVKTTSVNEGMDIVVKRYDSVSDTFVVQSAPAYANDWTANKFLDPGTGGSAITGGDTYVQYDNTELGEAKFKLFVRTAGITSITGTDASPTLTTSDTFTIQASQTNDDALTPVAPLEITLSGTTVADMAADINGANITNVSASVTGGFLTINHDGGGVIILVDGTNTPLASVGITASLVNVRDGNLANELIVSNWNFLTYTADIVVPGQDPLNDTRWYYSAIDEVDILIHENNVWKSYKDAGNTSDIRGHNLTATDPAGPIVAASAPDTQADGTTTLAYGDLWIDSSDLENYPVIRRWELVNAVDSWVLIDNADQTSMNGILFGDARWSVDGTDDIATADLAPISELLLSDTSSNFLDPDAPDESLYPDGMLLWNTRRSGYNVKEFRDGYFNAGDFNLDNNAGIDPDAWVTVSGKRDDGSANFGRLAQRALVVQALKAAIDTNSDVREEQRQFNLMSCPGYPELIPNMVALNNERSNTAFVVGDTPLRLENTGTAIAEWTSNNDGLGLVTNDGLASNDEYMGVFYPSGRTNDLSGTSIIVPPSHMILRTIIRSDEQSYPWLAPAGTRRGQVDNADAIGYVDAVTGEFQQMSTRQGIRDVLYTNNVNPITFIPGAGIVNYGNKTTKEGSALDRINVSRLTSYIRVQVDALAKQFVFEPNDKLTRDEIKGQMERLLNDLVAKRGLFDYVVVCDRSNNTNVRIDRNELWVDIAVEPVKAGEFIYVPIRIQNTGDISG